MNFFSVSLRSGSSGNSTFIQTESAALAVDCGMNGRQFALALQQVGRSAGAVDALLLTHEHTDHCSGVGVVMRRHKIPLYLTAGTFEAIRDSLGPVPDSLIHIIEAGQAFTVLDTEIIPFATPHDAVDSVGFRIRTRGGDVGVATDLGHFSQTVRQALEGCRIVHLEANYDPDMLETGSYPRFLKRRIAGPNGHLSNEEAALAAAWLIGRGTDLIALSHLSQENNLPDLALRTIRDYLLAGGMVEGCDYRLEVSPRYRSSSPFFCDKPMDQDLEIQKGSCPGEQQTFFEGAC